MRRVVRSLTIGVVSATVITGMVLPAGSAAAGAGRSAGHATRSLSATRGLLRPARVVKRAAAPMSRTSLTVSRRVPVRRSTKASRAVSPPTAGSTPLAGPGGTLLENFDGVSSLDSAKTNFGAEFEPPDQGLCVGDGFVVEPVNSAFRIFRTNGTSAKGPRNVNALFNDGPKQYTSDPRCYFDPTTDTWFAVILYLNPAFTTSRIDLAVNTSGDPRTPWTTFHIDTTSGAFPGHKGCPCFGDQPLLGVDGFNVYISTNEFSILGPQFNGAQIYAVSKSDLVNARSTVHFVHFDNLSIGGAKAASIQPADTVGGAPAEFFLNALDPFATFDDRIGVWAMTDRGAVSAGGTPTLSSAILSSEAYGIPPPTPQLGSTSTLDSDDDRMMQVESIGGELWGSLGTSVNIPNDIKARAGCAWFRIQPRLAGNVIGDPTMLAQGYVARQGNSLIYPSVAVNRNGDAVMVMTISSARRFPSVAYTLMRAGESAFGSLTVAEAGTGPYDPKATRWGDYSAASLDKSGAFWLATEYIPPVSSQTLDGKRNWGTRLLEVDPG